MAKIKPLVWSYNRAETISGLFYEVHVGYNKTVSLLLEHRISCDMCEKIGDEYVSVEAAKEAAQKHFETEILKWLE